jgi:arylsulfatase A-like enzyme
MLKNKRTWLIALVLVLIAGIGAIALRRAVFSGEAAGGRKVHVTLPADPVGSGSDEPGKVRVYVDNSGPKVSVAVRSEARPWKKSLKVDLNGDRTTLVRGRTPSGKCAPTVTAEPTSLLTRLDYDRGCLRGDTSTLDATVALDGAAPVTTSAPQTEKPNVLLIMVDDMRTDELQWMPNVQKLIGKQGVTFNNGFASLPLCCPARASVLTGLYPHNHGVWSHEAPWGFSALRDSDTLPVWMQRAGYYNTYLGKYLNGYGATPEPGRKTGTSTQYCPPGWDLWRGSVDGGMDPDDPQDGGTYRFFDTTLNDNCNGYLPLGPTYQTTAYGRLAGEQLVADKEVGKPWFNYVSFTAPHHGAPAESDDPDYLVTPARPKRIWGAFDRYIEKAPGADWLDPDRSDKPTRITKSPPNDEVKAEMLNVTRQRAEAVYLVDQQVKKIMGRLKATGQLDNTLVIFTSDNGYFLGEQGERQGKILPYEPSLRVPVLMRGPGIPKGEVRTDPWLSIDYAPTLADLSDARANPRMDGRSLLDVARLGDESSGSMWSRTVLTETKPTDAEQIKLQRKDPIGAHTERMLQGKTTGIRTGRYLYTEWLVEPGDKNPGATVELYDVLKDPEQYDNLADDKEYADTVAELHGVLAKARRCRAEECHVLLPLDLR